MLLRFEKDTNDVERYHINFRHRSTTLAAQYWKEETHRSWYKLNKLISVRSYLVMRYGHCSQPDHSKMDCASPFCCRCKGFGYTENSCVALCVKCKAYDHWNCCNIYSDASAMGSFNATVTKSTLVASTSDTSKRAIQVIEVCISGHWTAIARNSWTASFVMTQLCVQTWLNRKAIPIIQQQADRIQTKSAMRSKVRMTY